MSRYLFQSIVQDLQKKMVFVAGPRQVGKTHMAQKILTHFQSDQYYNWDRREHRQLIQKAGWDRTKKIVVLDELHKYRKWKSWLKGIYDTEKRGPFILVTGSARLDVYRRGGDSLLGRYFHYRLHPFSLKEFVLHSNLSKEEAFLRLWKRGGFPEPLLAETEFDAARWRQQRLETVIREDLLSIEQVRQLSALESLVDLLRERIASPLSFQSLAQDLEVSSPTIKAWIELLERMYVLFRVFPYSHSLSRAIRKEVKVYFYDYSDVPNEGARLENLIASHLLREVHYLRDLQGQKIELRTLRDKEKREVDFVVIKDGAPIRLVEVKTSETTPTRSILYYKERFPSAVAYQVVKDLNQSHTLKGVQVVPLTQYLMSLNC